jgi:CheY-like chemotaxis protein
LSVHRSGDSTTVRADRGQLEQVLVNLAVNSRDAMPEGGVLSIETGVADFSAEAVRILHPDLCAGRYVRLCVSDTGVGMPPEVVARAYEPFFTTRPKGEGTGLGLATVYGIVTEAGGTVAISSRPNLGTMVEVLLPAESAPVSPALTMTTEPERVDGLGETVVVVEDETPIRQVISRILRQHHYTVIEASTGEQGFGLIDDDCRLLLTDVIMPAMSGPELAEKVRRTRPHIPILFMSGYSRGVLGPQWSSQEGVAVIQKPFASELLLGMVSDAIAKSSRCEVVGR